MSESQSEPDLGTSNIPLADLSSTTNLSLVGHHGSTTSLGDLESLDDMTPRTNDQGPSYKTWEDLLRQPYRSMPRPDIICHREILRGSDDPRQWAKDEPSVSDVRYIHYS